MGNGSVDGDCNKQHLTHLGEERNGPKVAPNHAVPVVHDANGFLACLVGHAHTLLDQPYHELHHRRRDESGQQQQH